MNFIPYNAILITTNKMSIAATAVFLFIGAIGLFVKNNYISGMMLVPYIILITAFSIDLMEFFFKTKTVSSYITRKFNRLESYQLKIQSGKGWNDDDLENIILTVPSKIDAEVFDTIKNVVLLIVKDLELCNQKIDFLILNDCLNIYNIKENSSAFFFFDEKTNRNKIVIRLNVIYGLSWTKMSKSEIKKRLLKTIAHELRHLWQYKNDQFDIKNMDKLLKSSYAERETEKDAYKYEKEAEKRFWGFFENKNPKENK